MALKDLQKLKKSVDAPIQKKFYRYLVVGQDIFSLATYHFLAQKFGENEVGLLSKRVINRDDIALKGPSSLRGQTNIEYFQKLFPEIELERNEQSSSFFKEQKFREFGGRSKPEALLWGEEFYVDQSAQFNLEDIFSFINDDQFFGKLGNKLEVRIPAAIESTTPDDLVDNANWKVECADGYHFSCEHLLWGEGPADFLELVRNKSKLSSELIQYCDETRTPSSLFISFEFTKPVTERNETIFLPLSYTHEWGHFIGEFKSHDDGQRAEFVSFVVPEQTTEEEISKKIRILKRNLEKIFSGFTSASLKEYIILQEYSPCLKIDDSLLLEKEEMNKNLSFISTNGPVRDLTCESNSCEYSHSNLSHIARGLANLEQIKADFV